MSEKLRRQKDIVKNATESYLDATSVYQNYFDGSSPVQITYYQIADEASRTDTSLENTREIIGTQSSLYYYAIKNVSVYGINQLDISNQLTQRGIESFINGEFVMTPDVNIKPRSGEFFAFEDETSPELNEHLFIITDSQYDRATSNKFYKCSFKIYPKDKDNIIGQVIKTFVYDPSGNGNTYGVGDSVLITEEEAANKRSLDNLIDGLIDKYKDLFYNEGMDTFTYQRPIDANCDKFEYYWSPYICHFIYKNKILDKTNFEFLNEIFVQDYNESNFPAVYSERGYRKSIYFAVETDDPDVMDNISSGFMELSAYDINKPLNLPFFSSADRYILVDLDHPYNKDFWMGAFNWIFEDEKSSYLYNFKKYSYTKDLETLLKENDWGTYALDPYGNQTEDFTFYDGKEKLFINHLFYKVKNKSDFTDIESIVYPYVKNGEIDLMSAGILDIVKSESITTDDVDYLITLIRDYFYKKIKIDNTLLENLNNYFYENTIRNYLLIPVIIYILKNL